MAEYNQFVAGIADEVKVFKTRQAQGVKLEEARWVFSLLCEWTT